MNLAGAPIEVLWINGFEGGKPKLVQIVPPVRNGSDMLLNSFESHQFAIRFLNNLEIREAIFTKGGEDEDITVSFDPVSGTLTYHDGSRSFNAIYTIEEAIKKCEAENEGEGFISCVSEGAIDEMTLLSQSQARLNKYRDAIAFRLRNYTCADPAMGTSIPTSSYDFVWQPMEGPEVSYAVNIFLDTDHAKIWSVENFLTDAECETLEKVGRPILRRATVAAEDGTSMVSENRKAQQASYHTHQTNFEADPLFDLQQRILALTNYHANLSLTAEGQEGFTIIQYNPDDEYL